MKRKLTAIFSADVVGYSRLRSAPGSAYEQIEDKVPYTFEYLGEQKVRNIDPRFSLESYKMSLPHKEHADKERYVSALHKAGLK
jgi:hypothetical protein